jgi:hypothetical protein
MMPSLHQKKLPKDGISAGIGMDSQSNQAPQNPRPALVSKHMTKTKSTTLAAAIQRNQDINQELIAMLWRMHKAAYGQGDPWPSEDEVCALLAKAEGLFFKTIKKQSK